MKKILEALETTWVEICRVKQIYVENSDLSKKYGKQAIKTIMTEYQNL